MRNSRARLLGAVALLPVLTLTATACGDDGESSSGKTLTADQLKPVLPTQADLPAGWTTDDSEDGEDGGGERETAADTKCQPLLDLIDPEPGVVRPTAAVDSTAMRMEGDTPTEVLAVGLWAFSKGDAAKVFDDGRTALGKCASFTSTDKDGATTTWEFKKASAPKAGDASVAFTLKQTFEGETSYGSMVVVRVGNHQASFVRFDTTKEAAAPDAATVSKVVDKLKAAVKG